MYVLEFSKGDELETHWFRVEDGLLDSVSFSQFCLSRLVIRDCLGIRIGRENDSRNHTTQAKSS